MYSLPEHNQGLESPLPYIQSCSNSVRAVALYIANIMFMWIPDHVGISGNKGCVFCMPSLPFYSNRLVDVDIFCGQNGANFLQVWFIQVCV
jgi:hypothetical protein